jgi:hypothetical protein
VVVLRRRKGSKELEAKGGEGKAAHVRRMSSVLLARDKALKEDGGRARYEIDMTVRGDVNRHPLTKGRALGEEWRAVKGRLV